MENLRDCLVDEFTNLKENPEIKTAVRDMQTQIELYIETHVERHTYTFYLLEYFRILHCSKNIVIYCVIISPHLYDINKLILYLIQCSYSSTYCFSQLLDCFTKTAT